MNPDVGSAPAICASLAASCFPSLTHKVRMVVTSCLHDHRELEMGRANSPFLCHCPLVVVNSSGHHHAFVRYLVAWTLAALGTLEPTGLPNLVTHICSRRHCRNKSRGGGLMWWVACLRSSVTQREKALCVPPLAKLWEMQEGPLGNGVEVSPCRSFESVGSWIIPVPTPTPCLKRNIHKESIWVLRQSKDWRQAEVLCLGSRRPSGERNAVAGWRSLDSRCQHTSDMLGGWGKGAEEVLLALGLFRASLERVGWEAGGIAPGHRYLLKKREKKHSTVACKQRTMVCHTVPLLIYGRSIWREPAGCLTKWLCFSAPKLKLPLGKWKSENFSSTEEKLKKKERRPRKKKTRDSVGKFLIGINLLNSF